MKKSLIFSIVFIWFSTATAFSQNSVKPPLKPLTIGVCNGSATYLPKPDYPKADANVSGAVNVVVEIDTEGNVKLANAISGHPLLRAEAEKAALKAKFNLMIFDGKPVERHCVLIYNFISPKSISRKKSLTGRSKQSKNTCEKRKFKSLIISCGVCNGKATYLSVPEYPDIARRFHVSGSIKVQIIIDEDGSVIKAAPISGHPFLWAESVKAAQRAKFAPTILRGKPIRVYGVIVYNFSFDK